MDGFDQCLSMVQYVSDTIGQCEADVDRLGEVVHVDEGVGAAVAMYEHVNKKIGEDQQSRFLSQTVSPMWTYHVHSEPKWAMVAFSTMIQWYLSK